MKFGWGLIEGAEDRKKIEMPCCGKGYNEKIYTSLWSGNIFSFIILFTEMWLVCGCRTL